MIGGSEFGKDLGKKEVISKCMKKYWRGLKYIFSEIIHF